MDSSSAKPRYICISFVGDQSNEAMKSRDDRWIIKRQSCFFGGHQAVYTFRKKPGASPYYPDNSNLLASCALVDRILKREVLAEKNHDQPSALKGPIQLISWNGGRKDSECLNAGIDARVVAAMDVIPGTDRRTVEEIMRGLAVGLGAECTIIRFEEAEEKETTDPQPAFPGILIEDAPSQSSLSPGLCEMCASTAYTLPMKLMGEGPDWIGDLLFHLAEGM